MGQASAELERACDAISEAYRFYSAGSGAEAGEDSAFRGGLATVVQSALRQRVGIEGGIWQRKNGSLAYAYPTYEGSGPKTDLPQAELPRIDAINRIAVTDERPSISRYAAPSQTLPVDGLPAVRPNWLKTVFAPRNPLQAGCIKNVAIRLQSGMRRRAATAICPSVPLSPRH